MSMDITAIGDISADILTFPIRSYPKKDFKKIVPSINLQVGGGAANFAFAISKLGMKTRLMGLIGEDFFGDYIWKRIEDLGIDNKVKRTDEKDTGITIGISFEDGSRSLISSWGTNSLFSKNDFEVEDIEGKALCLSGYNFLKGLQKDVYKLFVHARDLGIVVGLEPDLKSGVRCDINQLKKTLKLVDLFFLNKEEGKMITQETEGKRIVEKTLDLGCGALALKLGERGCMVGTKADITRIKPFKVNPISTTGAGDVFNAAFTYEYLKSKDVKKAGKFANAAGALSTIKIGSKRFSTEEQVVKFMKRRK